jgi:hypothetical protein
MRSPTARIRDNILSSIPLRNVACANSSRIIRINPFTIDSGHVEPEVTLFSYFRESKDDEGTTTHRFVFASTDFRIGILNNFEIGVDVSPYNVVGMNFVGPVNDKWVRGPDTLGLEAKYNLYGNDTFGKPGTASLAILAALELPTVRNGVGDENIEGSVAFPFAIRLSEKTELELMTKYDFIKNQEGSGYHVEFFNSWSYSYDWTSKLSTYFEVATRLGNEDPSGPIVDIGIGAAYVPREDLQLDCGVNIGLTKAADPINPFFGIVRAAFRYYLKSEYPRHRCSRSRALLCRSL